MNYKVTFYKDYVELLTERKANFVNKLKALTSRVFEQLAQKVGTRGKTNGMAILEFLKQMAASGKKVWHGAVTLDDYRNLEIDYLPNTGEPIPFKFKFIYDGENDYTKFSSSGHCLQKIIRGKMFIAEIYLELHFTLGRTEDRYAVRDLINTVQHTLVHEIAHAKDESNVEELKSYKDKSRTSDADIQYIEYWLKPTEIRSHMNEMIQILSSKRYNNPKRTMKRMYKDSDKAQERGMEFTDELKNRYKKVYGMLNKSMSEETTDEKSKDALMTVLNRAFRGQCQKLLKNFIFDYHIAFIRDSSPMMKQRYYDKYFPNTDVPSLEQMKEFHEAIKNVTRGFTKLKSEVIKSYKKSITLYGHVSDEDRQMVDEFNEMYGDLWIIDTLSSAFQSYNYKLLKKLGKQMIEKFREKYNLLTKGMLTKQAKAYTRELEKKYGKGSEGMEDFFNSTPPKQEHHVEIPSWLRHE